MAKLVKQIHDLIDLAINKGLTGYISDSQKDDAIDLGQMMLFRQLLAQFPKNKRVRNDLLPFEVKAPVTISSSIGSLPSDFEQEIEAWITVSSVNYPVTFVESGFFRRRVLDKVDPPSATNVFATVYNDSGKKIELSSHVTPLQLLYFKRPTKPLFATTLSGGQYIYDDAGSTDVLWSATLHDILVENTLSVLGLNMRDFQVIRAGQKSEPKELSL